MDDGNTLRALTLARVGSSMRRLSAVVNEARVEV